MRFANELTAEILHGDTEPMQPPYLRTWFKQAPAGENVIYLEPGIQEHLALPRDPDTLLSPADYEKLVRDLEIKYPYSFELTLKHLAVYGKKVYMEFITECIKKGWLKPSDHLPTTL